MRCLFRGQLSAKALTDVANNYLSRLTPTAVEGLSVVDCQSLLRPTATCVDYLKQPGCFHTFTLYNELVQGQLYCTESVLGLESFQSNGCFTNISVYGMSIKGLIAVKIMKNISIQDIYSTVFIIHCAIDRHIKIRAVHSYMEKNQSVPRFSPQA